ncbi:hypothetical protein [Jatrophihabitans fulvus]
MSDPLTPVAPRPAPWTADRRLAVAVLLTVLGLLLWVGSRLIATGGEHSWDPGASAPSSYEFDAGRTYSIAIPGGVGALRDRGLALTDLACTFTPVGGAPASLALTVESDGTRAVNRLARFAAPQGGRAAVQCPGAGAIFVDDAVDSEPDWSGYALLAGAGLLVVGLPLLLSAVRRRRVSGTQ